MIRAEYAGEEAPETVTRRTTVEFSEEGYRVRFSGQIVDEGTFEINPADPAKKLVLLGTSGTNEGRTIRSIYQLVGDRLRVCYGRTASNLSISQPAPDRIDISPPTGVLAFDRHTDSVNYFSFTLEEPEIVIPKTAPENP